jgi:hypothetical protein
MTRKIPRFALVGLLLASAQDLGAMAALADPVTLICNNPYQPGTAPFTIDLDQAESAVTQSVPASPNVAASSTKMPATFDSKEIKYNVGSWAYTINRVTGNVSAVDGNGRTAMNFPCHVGKTQF